VIGAFGIAANEAFERLARQDVIEIIDDRLAEIAHVVGADEVIAQLGSASHDDVVDVPAVRAVGEMLVLRRPMLVATVRQALDELVRIDEELTQD
jgi:hypothetical protein